VGVVAPERPDTVTDYRELGPQDHLNVEHKARGGLARAPTHFQVARLELLLELTGFSAPA
jgi:hypothetical protein